MPFFICTTCGTQFAESAQPPAACRICGDERQYVGLGGQHWTTARVDGRGAREPPRGCRAGHHERRDSADVRDRPARAACAAPRRQRAVGLRVVRRSGHCRQPGGAWRRLGDRDLASAFLLVDGRVESGVRRRADLSPQRRRRLGVAAGSARDVLGGGDVSDCGRPHAGPLRRALRRLDACCT